MYMYLYMYRQTDRKKKKGWGQLRSTKGGEGDRVVPLTKGGWEGDVDGPHVLGNVGLERRAGGKPDGAREGHEQLDGEDAENLPDETLPNLDKKKKKRKGKK